MKTRASSDCSSRNASKCDGLLAASEVTGALVLARHRFVGDDALERGNRFERDVEQLARARFAEAGHERRRIELHAGEHLAAVARAGAPSHALALEDDDGRTAARKLARRGKSGVARADDDHVGAGGQVGGAALLTSWFESSVSGRTPGSESHQ